MRGAAETLNRELRRIPQTPDGSLNHGMVSYIENLPDLQDDAGDMRGLLLEWRETSTSGDYVQIPNKVKIDKIRHFPLSILIPKLCLNFS